MPEDSQADSIHDRLQEISKNQTFLLKRMRENNREHSIWLKPQKGNQCPEFIDAIQHIVGDICTSITSIAHGTMTGTNGEPAGLEALTMQLEKNCDVMKDAIDGLANETNAGLLEVAGSINNLANAIRGMASKPAS